MVRGISFFITVLLWLAPLAVSANQARDARLELTPVPEEPSLILKNQNETKFSVEVNHQELGTILGLSRSNAVLIPLEQLFNILQIPIDADLSTKHVEGVLIDRELPFILDMPQHKVMVGDKSLSFDPSLTIANDNDIYLDISVLDRILPMHFTLDRVSGTISISVPKDANLLLQEHLYRLAGSISTKVSQTAIPMTDDNVLLLQPKLRDELYDDILEVYGNEQQLMLPLLAVSKILGFQITMDSSTSQVKGYIITSDRSFELDPRLHHVAIAGKGASFPSHAVEVRNDEIYVDGGLLMQWLPIDIRLDTTSMTLLLTPKELLPAELKAAREKQHKRAKEFLSFQEAETKRYEIKQEPYAAIRSPFIDLDLREEYSRNRGFNDGLNTIYSMLSSTDVAYHTTSFFISGQSREKNLDSIRLSMGRKDSDNGLLGRLHASEYMMGDIDSFSIPLVASTSLGRGASITNAPSNQGSSFDTRDFVGDSLPGWEVELYRNGLLIDFQLVASDGRYQFLNVPLVFGANEFRFVMYGPQGQIEERVERVFVGETMVKKGHMQYRLSIDEKAHSLFGVDSLGGNGNEGFRSVASVEYGLTDTLSVGVGAVHTPIESVNHDYLTGMLRSNLFGMLASLDTAFDIKEQGSAATLGMFTGYKSTSLKLSQSFFDHFQSEQEAQTGIYRRSASELDVDTSFNLPVIDDIAMGFNALYQRFEVGDDELRLSHRLSKSILGIGLSHTLEYSVRGDQPELFRGELGLNARLLGTLFRTNVTYQARPESSLERIAVSLQRRLTKDVTGILGYTKDLNNDGRNSINGSLNWDLKKYRLGTTLDIDDDGQAFVGLGINMSLSRNLITDKWQMQSAPLAHNGGLNASAYLDKNNNLIRDADEDLLPDVGYKLGLRPISSKGDHAYATDLFDGRPTNVRIDTATLSNPLWYPAVEGYTVKARPGVTTNVSFPVIITSEIDGSVLLIDPNNEEGEGLGLSNVTIILISEDGEKKREVRTDFDGFFLFDKIPAGNYRLSIGAEDAKRLGVKQVEDVTLEVAKDGDFYNGNDIHVIKQSPMGE